MSAVKSRPMPPKLRKATPEEKRALKLERYQKRALASKRKVQLFGGMKRQSKAKSRPGRLSRAQEERLYSGLAKALVARCQREGEYCQVMFSLSGRRQKITQIHHLAGREGSLLLAQEHWMGVSAAGHKYIHSHPNEAREHGWLYEVSATGEIRKR